MFEIWLGVVGRRQFAIGGDWFLCRGPCDVSVCNPVGPGEGAGPGGGPPSGLQSRPGESPDVRAPPAVLSCCVGCCVGKVRSASSARAFSSVAFAEVGWEVTFALLLRDRYRPMAHSMPLDLNIEHLTVFAFVALALHDKSSGKTKQPTLCLPMFPTDIVAIT